MFPNPKVFASWYKDFSGVQTVTNEDLAMVPLAGNVTYRPGVKLVKIQSDPKVYAVAQGERLRWVVSPTIAAKLYGTNWVKQVDDIDATFFRNYKIGDPIEFAD